MGEIWNSRLKYVLGEGDYTLRPAEAVRAIACPTNLSLKSFSRQGDHSDPEAISRWSGLPIERQRI